MNQHHAAVLGSPIAHSLSPVLHNAAYRALGLTDWEYGRQEVREAALGTFFQSIDSTWAGVSMTMPLKKEALRFGDTQDERVAFLGVANTAVFDWNRSNSHDSALPFIHLYNTDVDGIKRTFHDEFLLDNCSDKRVLILGSGSTATSAIAALMETGARDFTVCAVQDDQAHHVAKLMTQYPAAHTSQTDTVTISVAPWSDAIRFIPQADIIIAAVPAHATDTLAADVAQLPPYLDVTGTYVLDVIYDPRPTDFMHSMELKGAHVRGGEHMLLRQAIAQVAYMTSLDVSEIMDKAFLEMKNALIEQL
ncbi:shikimate dehydrogenase family protein [Alloscardovia criceti]|uniref:shikimate dehydrogenase family protein n=1 Tax=Alloscardovia criceti TaxID=356828 RepID=UPI000380AA51|nr:hypothetical protein [Alloscardovia criceti]